ncbi:MAG: DUF1552 domain-containing protein [Nannocystaceae bacterium]
MNRFTLSRRTMLRGGASLAVGLPILEAMLNSHGDAFAGGGDLPLRFLMYYWADGVNIERFEPTQTGANWDLSEQMMPLAPVKDYINLVTGLRNLCEDQITHHEGMTVFNGYSFVYQGGLSTDAGGPTIDQVIADRIGDQTVVRSVQVRVSKRESTDGDGGTTVTAISHRGTPGNLTPQIPQANPRDVFDYLFGNFTPEVDDRSERTHVLDAVKEDVARLKMRLGTIDRQRLDAHLTGIDELQTKINAMPPSCQLPGEPTEDNTDTGGEEPISSVVQAHAELIAYAFACDVTRVASFLFKKFVSSTVFDEINATNMHHSSSHNGPEDPNYKIGLVYCMEKLSQVLQVLMNTEEVTGGNLLDSTIVYASTDCSTGNTHSINRQPIILAGHGRNYLAYPGIHYQATPWNNSHPNPNATGNTSDVLLTCLQAFDDTADSIGGGAPQSSTPLTEVLG